jgi:hypothetical protein
MDIETRQAIAELDTVEPKSIDDVRQIVTGSSAMTFYWGSKSNKLLVDMQSANVVCTVYDGVRPELKERILKDIVTSRESFTKLVDMCWKVLSK